MTTLQILSLSSAFVLSSASIWVRWRALKNEHALDILQKQSEINRIKAVKDDIIRDLEEDLEQANRTSAKMKDRLQVVEEKRLYDVNAEKIRRLELQVENARLSDIVKGGASTNKALKQEVSELEQRMKEESILLEQDFNSQLEFKDFKIKELEEIIDQINTTLQEEENKVYYLEKEIENNKVLRNELGRVKAQLVETQSEFAGLEHENEILTMEVENFGIEIKTNSELHARIKDLEAELLLRQKTMADFSEAEDKIVTWQERFFRTHDEKKQLEYECKELEAKLAECKERYFKSVGERNELELELEDEIDQNKRLREELVAELSAIVEAYTEG